MSDTSSKSSGTPSASRPRRAEASSHRSPSCPAGSADGARRKPKTPSAAALGRGAERSVQQRAAAILEVLAGERTAAEAARFLGLSVMHYYLLERRALEGLVVACAPQPKGPRGPRPETELARLRRELERSRRECQRQAALVRATQRALGFPAAAAAKPAKSPENPGNPGNRRSRRRATVRALRAAQTLRQNSSGPSPADVVERSPTEDTSRLGAGLPAAAAAVETARREVQEAEHDASGQEAGGHGTRGAVDGLALGQGAAEGVVGDAAG